MQRACFHRRRGLLWAVQAALGPMETHLKLINSLSSAPAAAPSSEAMEALSRLLQPLDLRRGDEHDQRY